MDRDLARLHAEYHPHSCRDIRLQPMEMQALIDADIENTDTTGNDNETAAPRLIWSKRLTGVRWSGAQ